MRAFFCAIVIFLLAEPIFSEGKNKNASICEEQRLKIGSRKGGKPHSVKKRRAGSRKAGKGKKSLHCIKK